jgi:HPt (histidine-containing phosphotransfer) domain-containing protein
MSNGDEELERALAKLRAKYLAELPQRLADIRADLAKAEAGDAAAMQNVRLLLHRLAGSAGTHGFDLATSRARAAENLAAEVCDSSSTLDPAQAARLQGLVADLQAAFGLRAGG